MSERAPAVFADPEVHAGFVAYIDLIEQHFDDVTRMMSEQYAAVPAFAPLAAGLTQASMKAQNEANVARLRQAAAGDWGPYLDNLRERGVTYAKAGIPFVAWTELFQRSLLQLLDLAFRVRKDDPAALRVLVRGMAATLDTVVQTVGATYFDANAKTLRALEANLRAVATPVLSLDEPTLLVPLIGAIDDGRARDLVSRLLAAIAAHRARVVVLDVTGVPTMDDVALRRLFGCTRAAVMMGAHVSISGLSTEISEAIVALDVPLDDIPTYASLQAALAAAREDGVRRAG